MDLSELARKQARIRGWSEFLFNDSVDDDLRLNLGTTLELYKKVIVRSWERREISQEDERQLARLERQLEDINERIRLSAPKTLSREYEK